ncbi:hypothetical protein Cni_G11797 [Canna indica]|uniref:Phytosulfokine n=1 Tax=Canna indica TaxID=4628 RepID=A0AAQ3KAU3_9LILI|nr:hypothetical protein Cni_G11797 [Canna indica]
MSSKYTTIFVIALLFIVSLGEGEANRHEPADNLRNTIQEGVEKDSHEGACGGVGEEDCLTRRTLAAHIDYIYSQGN